MIAARCADAPASRCGPRGADAEKRISGDPRGLPADGRTSDAREMDDRLQDDCFGGDPRAGARSADAPHRCGLRAVCHSGVCRSAACQNSARLRGTDANCVQHGQAKTRRVSARAWTRPDFVRDPVDYQNPCAGHGLVHRAKTSCRRRIFSPADRRRASSPGDDRLPAAASRCTGGLLAGGHRPCENPRRAGCRVASRHPPAAHKASCRRIFCRRSAQPDEHRSVALAIAPIVVRAIAARGGWAIVPATVFTRPERTLFTITAP